MGWRITRGAADERSTRRRKTFAVARAGCISRDQHFTLPTTTKPNPPSLSFPHPTLPSSFPLLSPSLPFSLPLQHLPDLRCVSISPSSMRKPRILTWSSARPMHSTMPSGM